MRFKQFNDHKFNARRTKRGSFNFSSRLEAQYFDYLCLLQKAKEIDFFLRQVPFHLPGNVTYRCDFQIFWKDGRSSFIDVKGYETPEFKMKKKMVEDLYPIKIRIIKKGDF